MINVRKTRLMTKCAVYERAEGGEDIRMSRYFQSDYVRLNFLKTVLYTTVGYLLVCIMIGLIRLDYLIDNALELEYTRLGIMLGLIYVAVLVSCLILSWVVFSLKYIRSRKRLSDYYRMLRQINRFNEEDMQLKKLEDK